MTSASTGISDLVTSIDTDRLSSVHCRTHTFGCLALHVWYKNRTNNKTSDSYLSLGFTSVSSHDRFLALLASSFQLCFVVAAEMPGFTFLGRLTLICPTHVTLGNRSSSSSSSVHCLPWTLRTSGCSRAPSCHRWQRSSREVDEMALPSRVHGWRDSAGQRETKRCTGADGGN
jgi:hypothetical protein